jgi:eukaryotic-like serine/threonine-protein kinase
MAPNGRIPHQIDPLDIDKELTRVAAANALFDRSLRPVRMGRFEILQLLGRGAMGAVYEARDDRDGAVVALKLIDGSRAAADALLKREFRSLADVVHPNLVALYELFIDPPHRFFTMERIAGEPFDEWVRASDVDRREPRLRAALRQLAEGLDAIHAAGCLHGDIKPTNVLVTEAGRVVVLDFGLVGELTSIADAPMAGTPLYMAPELPVAAPSCARDFYALGVMLFEALTGRPPFSGDLLELQTAKRQANAPDPRAYVEGLPDDLSELCMALLHFDPSRRATARDVVSVLGRDQPPPRASGVHSGSRRAHAFVGRDSELARMKLALDDTGSGRATVAFVSGRSGIGKTALLERWIADAMKAGAVVLCGRCHERESIPYNAFDGVLDALGHQLATAAADVLRELTRQQISALCQFPTLGARLERHRDAEAGRGTAPRSRELRGQAFGALKEVLQRLSRRAPLVITIDDLQWADVDSAELLQYVLGSPNPTALLLVGVHRSGDEDSSELVARLFEGSGPWQTWPDLRIELGPLEPDLALELARTVLLSAPGHEPWLAAKIAGEAAGEPLFILQLAERLWMNEAPGHTIGRGPSTISLEQLVLERVANLPASAQRLLQILSISPGPLSRSIASEAAELAPDDQTALRALHGARLLRTVPTRSGQFITPYHDRIRDSLLRETPATTASGLHAKLAVVIERRDSTDMERLLVHYRAAGDLLNAGRAAVRAAQAAADKLAFNHAAALFQMAIECLPATPHNQLDLQRQLGDALVQAGRGARAAEAYLRASEAAPPPSRLALRGRAAAQYLRSGRTREGLELTHEVVASLGMRVPPSERAALRSLIWERARLHLRRLRLAAPSAAHTDQSPVRLALLSDVYVQLSAVDPLFGFLLQTRALREALATGDLASAVRGLIWEAFNAALLGGPRNERYAERILARARPLVAREGSPYARGLLALTECARLLYANRNFADARAFGAHALAVFANECPHAFTERAGATFFHDACLHWTGEFTKSAEYDALIAESSEREDDFTALLLLHCWTSQCLRRDDSEAALHFLDQRRAQLGQGYSVLRHFWLFSRIQVLMYAGRATDGCVLLQSEWQDFRKSHFWRSESTRMGYFDVRARCALAAFLETGQPAFRADFTRSITPVVKSACPAYRAFAIALRAVLYARAGRRERAIADLGTSAVALQQAQAYGLERHAQRALATLSGDDAGLERVDSELRAQGVANPQRYSSTYLPW